MTQTEEYIKKLIDAQKEIDKIIENVRSDPKLLSRAQISLERALKQLRFAQTQIRNSISFFNTYKEIFDKQEE